MTRLIDADTLVSVLQGAIESKQSEIHALGTTEHAKALVKEGHLAGLERALLTVERLAQLTEEARGA